jgi:hypothetical protein
MHNVYKYTLTLYGIKYIKGNVALNIAYSHMLHYQIHVHY